MGAPNINEFKKHDRHYYCCPGQRDEVERLRRIEEAAREIVRRYDAGARHPGPVSALREALEPQSSEDATDV